MVESQDDISESEMSEDSIIILADNSDEVSELSDLEAMGKKKVYCTGKNSVNSKHLKFETVNQGDAYNKDEQTEYMEDECNVESCVEGATCNAEENHREKSNFSECLTFSRGYEENENEVEVKTEEVKSSKITGVTRPRLENFENLQEPGRNGWLREVVYSKAIKHLVILINYIPPGGKGPKLNSKKDILTYLAKSKNTLSMENFSFSKRLLGLGNDFEVFRKSSQDNTQKKSYQQFFKYLEGSFPPLVSCNLCDGKVTSYQGFSDHMGQYHLPEETCSKCHEDIPAVTFKNHTSFCDGTVVGAQTGKQDLMSSYRQFYSPLQGSTPLCVACNLCGGKAVSYYNFTKHMRAYHLPDEKCSKCHKDVGARIFKNHIQVCDGTGTEPTLPLSSPLNYREFFTHLQDTSPSRVACNICNGKSVVYNQFARHMRHFHLPDETCSKCLKDVPARVFENHRKICDGSGTTPTVPPSLHCSQFFTKVDASFPQLVACNLCDVKLRRKGFNQHYKRYHKSDESQSDPTTRSIGDTSTSWEEKKVLETKPELGMKAVNDHKKVLEKDLEHTEEKLGKPKDQEEGDVNTNYLELDTTTAGAISVSLSSTDVSELAMSSETELDDI